MSEQEPQGGRDEESSRLPASPRARRREGARARRAEARARRRADPAHLTETEVRSTWTWLRAVPGRVAALLADIWRTERHRLWIMALGVVAVVVLLSVLGTGRLEIWEILSTVALGALVLAVSRDHRTAGGVVVSLLVLSLVGTLAGPRWSPAPVHTDLAPTTTDTAIGGDVDTPAVGTYDVETTTVEITQADGETRPAVLRRPKGVAGATRAVVFMHGAGTHTAWGFAEQAESIASTGVTTLVPSKPMEGYSTTSRDYVSMAADYARSVDWLREQDYIDPDQVGIYAESEGDFPGVVLAAQDQRIAFLVLASAPVVLLRQQASYAAVNYLENVGVPSALLSVIPRVLGSKEIPGGGFDYVDFDARSYEERIRVPILMLYGTGDSSMPLVQGPETVRDAIAANGNTALTVRYYNHANHGLKLGNSTDGDLAPGVARDLSRWIDGLPVTATAKPQVAGATPVQDFSATTPGATRWYASGDLMVLAILSGFLLLIAAGLFWLLGQAPRLVGRRGLHLPDPVGRWTGALALSVTASWVLYLAYIVAVARLAISYESNPWLSYGGWAVAQLSALGTLILLVKLVSRAWNVRGHERHGRDEGGRWLTVPSGAVLALALAGTVVLLVDLSYWGLFPVLF